MDGRLAFLPVLSGLIVLGLSFSADADAILDNDFRAPAYTESGFWTTSDGIGFRGGTYRYTARSGAWARWNPRFPQNGRYEVIAVFRSGANRAETVRYTIRHAGGTAEVPVNQYAGSSKMEEVSLGEYDFNAGSEGFVRLDSVLEGKVCIADAIIYRSNRDDPPMILLADRSPVRPLSTDAVRVSIQAFDDDEVVSVSAVYRVLPSAATQEVQAFDDGAHGDGAAGDGLFAATIPAQPGDATVEYWMAARDSAGQISSSPVDSYIVSATPYPEFRAIWSASWWAGFRSPEEANELVSTCREHHLNTLLPEVRKVGDAYYDSALEPRADNITGGEGFDPLGYLMQLARDTSDGKKRLQVHPWFVVHRVWNSAAPLPEGHILRTHPEYEMINRDGSSDPAVRWLDPGHPGAVDHNVAVILDCLSKYPVDGIHLDYIRYNGSATGYNPVSVERFNAWQGRTGVPDATDAAWCDWRRECVSLEVKKIYIQLYKVNPDVLLSTATFSGGDYDNFQSSSAYRSAFQDWVTWLNQGTIDYNMIMNYKDETQWDNYRGWVDRSLAEDGRRGSVPGISGNPVASVQTSMDQLKYIRNRGADGMIIFSWKGEVSGNNELGETREQFYGALKDQLFPTWVEPPEAAWKTHPVAGIFEGVVTSGGQPVDHASVWIEGLPETRTVTDGSGWYGILDAPPGDRTLRFSKPGFQNKTIPSSIAQAGDVVTVDAELILAESAVLGTY